MSFKSKVVVATNKQGLEKVLEVSKNFKPTKILTLSKYSVFILTWDWVAWNNWSDLPCKKIEELHSKETPRIVGVEVGYWDNENLIYL